MDIGSDDFWSDTSSEDGCQDFQHIQPRGYQIEMFEHSMKENTIVVVRRTVIVRVYDGIDIFADGNWERENSSVSKTPG